MATGNEYFDEIGKTKSSTEKVISTGDVGY
jgi:hypothetical protein